MSILLVGAGGLGCEIADCLASAPAHQNLNFSSLAIVDNDLIDVSNLNRCCLFNGDVVGKSKADVVKEKIDSPLKYRNVTVESHCCTIEEFDLDFFSKFSLVICALDNNSVRAYVSRMCHRASVAMLDGGTAGLLGQTRWFLRNGGECFDCRAGSEPEQTPVCTLKAKPTSFEHCIAWAKHFFTAFWEFISDIKTENTMQMSLDLFSRDVYRMLKDLKKENIYSFIVQNSFEVEQDIDQKILKVNEEAMEELYLTILSLKKIKENDLNNQLTSFDKDNSDMLTFVHNVALIRAGNFRIRPKDKFQTKAISGNIIPSVVTTNAAVAGLMIDQMLKFLKLDKYDFQSCSKCLKNIYLNSSSKKGKYFSFLSINKFNPDCILCGSDTKRFKLEFDFKQPISNNICKFLQSHLHIVQYDLIKDGSIVLSFDDEDNVKSKIDFKSDIEKNSSLPLNILCIDYSHDIVLEIEASHKHRAFDLEKKLKYKIKKKNNSIRNKLVKLNKKRKYHHPYYVENTPEIYNEDQYKHDLSIEKQQRAPSTAKYFHQTQATVPIVKNNLQKDERFMKNLSEATEALNQSLYDNSMPSNLSIESEYEQIQSRMGVHQFWKKKDVDEIKMKNSQHLTNDQRPVPRPTNFLEELKLYHNRMKK